MKSHTDSWYLLVLLKNLNCKLKLSVCVHMCVYLEDVSCPALAVWDSTGCDQGTLIQAGVTDVLNIG